MKISVIVPFYNEERYIQRCIESLENQSLAREFYELIFINHNSTDRSEEIVKSFPSIKLLKETGQGVYKARNRGLETAAGTIIAFTDADCEVSHDWLKNIKEALTDSRALFVLGERGLGRKSSGILNLLSDYENEKIQYILDRGMRGCYYGYANNMAVNKKLIDQVGLFSESPVGDTEWVQKAMEKGDSDAIQFIPLMKISHLEINSPWEYFNKMRIHCYGNETLKSKTPYQALDFKHKINILKLCLAKKKYSLRQRSLFLLSLVVGNSYALWGRLEYRLKFQKG